MTDHLDGREGGFEEVGVDADVGGLDKTKSVRNVFGGGRNIHGREDAARPPYRVSEDDKVGAVGDQAMDDIACLEVVLVAECVRVLSGE